MNRILVTRGDGEFREDQFDANLTPKSKEICVRSVMTGICRSDIDMMIGKFGPLPLHMQGHEGLGQVTSVGCDVIDVAVGDYVATRGEPAYADFYIAKESEYVQVPEADPKYIVEPVACAINLIEQSRSALLQKHTQSRLLLLGSGFLAHVVYQYLTKVIDSSYDITVIGNSNQDIWGAALTQKYSGTFDVVVDLGSGMDVFEKDILNNEALVIMGNQKTVSTDFARLLWKSATMTFPSPRNRLFHQCMCDAVTLIQSGCIEVDRFWTKGYNRDSEWHQAFRDGLNRPRHYSRGYIQWH